MQTPPPADDAAGRGLREWQTLSRKLSHARGFCFIVYFVRDQRLAATLKLRLRDWLQAAGGELIDIAPDTPDLLVAGSTAPLFQQPQPTVADGAPQRVFWLEAFRGAGKPEWTAPREQLLMRLNERRSRLEAELRAPLVLLLPAGEQRLAATLAPDLWHIRIHSAALEASDAMTSLPSEDRTPKDAPLVAPDAAADEPRAVAWWREQRASAAQQAGDAPDAGAAPVDLWDGFNAIVAAMDSGRFDQARQLVDDILQLATAQWQASTRGQRANATRQLAQAHTMAGVLANLQGRFDAALAAMETAVQHMRTAVAEEPASMHDLSMLAAQLNQLGIALKGLDRLDAAARAFDEALVHARWLARQPDAGPAAQQALAVSLGHAGDVYRLRGEWDRAEAVLGESLALFRALPGPDARALGVALYKLAVVAQQQGRLDAAASAFAEALAIDRSRLAENNHNLQALDDVAVDLEALAGLDGAPLPDRLAAAAEALQLRQRQAELHPEVQPFRLAWARARQTFDNLQSTDSQRTP